MTDPTKTSQNNSGTYRAVTDGDLREPMNLGDFLLGLGIVLRLPGKKRAITAADVVAEIPTTHRRSRLVAAVLMLVIIIALAVLVPAMLPTRSDPIPASLIGSWQTQSPKFANRGFEIRGNALRMKRGTAETDVAALAIHRVRVRPRGGDTNVEIEYVEDGVRQTMSLTMRDFGGLTTVELQHKPDVIWRRARSESAPSGMPAGLELPAGALNTPPRQ